MSQPFEANSFDLSPGLRLLEASAGTGKTFALAHLVLRYVTEAGLDLGELLVVTFTEAAAAELRDRIGMRLQAALACLDAPEREPDDLVLAAWLLWARPRVVALRAPLLLALEQLESADITTIHGFCRRTLQRQALEAAQPPDLQLEADSAALLRQIANDYWQQQVLPLPLHLLAGLQRQLKGPEALERLLRSLESDPALKLEPLPAGCSADEPLAPQLERVWQQAWSGFCTQWGSRGRALEADCCAAAAQWRAAAAVKTTPYSPKPTKDRCAALEAWIAQQPSGGDHGACLEQSLFAGYFHPAVFSKVARSCGDGDSPSLPQAPLLETIAAICEGPAELLLLHACHWGRRELRLRRERGGRFSFGQLLEALDPGEQAITPLLEAVARRYRAALIDEFQDTDPIQWRILGRAFDPGRHRIVLVGDPKQAIYRFRGGELATYRRAREQAAAASGVSALAVNFRSSEALIAGLNRLMQPGLRRSELPVPPVSAGSPRAPLDDGAPLQVLWLGSERAAGSKAPSRTALEPRATAAAADHTAALLNRGVAARHVCLLVLNHRQAERLRTALEQRGIASRLVSQGDVFEGAAATALQRLLDAMADPARLGRLRLLAASPLLGWSAARLAAASPDDWSALAAQLSRAAEQLPRIGLLAVLAALLNERGLAQLALGGRLLADLQQCAQLVQERIHADQLGPAAAADWLRRLRLDEDRLVPEAHQPNSAAVDAAVAVVTVHRSKGLEYPVVICPYLWQVPSGEQGPLRLGVRWQPSGSGADPVLDLHLSRHWGRGFAARRQQRDAELAERERLAYVAVTRAQQLLVLAWGPAAGQQANPLQPWLFSRDPLSDPDHDDLAARSDADWLALLQAEIAARQVPLVVLQPAAAPVHAQDPPLSAAPALALGPVPSHGFDSSWGRSSYTSWTRGSHVAGPAALEEGRETDGVVAELALEPGALRASQGSGNDDNGPLARFPRGAGAGDCLHRILEQFAFDQPAALQTALVGRELERAGIAAEQLEPLLEGLERLRLTPLGGPLERSTLAELPSDQRLHEMGFDLPLALVQAPQLAQAFVDHPQGPFGADYGASLAQLPIASSGFLTGSIDLAFAHGHRWWVLDWKSNWLGERDAAGQPHCCGPRHYSHGAMAALMAANHYPLQAHLYLVALHRYLRWRLPGYDPACHLGGYIYVFLRGVPGPTTAEPVPGVFIEQPPLQRLLALDRVLEAG